MEGLDDAARRFSIGNTLSFIGRLLTYSELFHESSFTKETVMQICYKKMVLIFSDAGFQVSWLVKLTPRLALGQEGESFVCT